MSDETQVEVGHIRITLELGEHGMAPRITYEGVTPEAAIGYMRCAEDFFQDEIANRDFDMAVAAGDIEVTCDDPDCENCHPDEDDDDDD